MKYWLLFLSVIYLNIWHVSCIPNTHLKVPELVDIHESVPISCSYNLKGHRLYALKLYMNNYEFFRFVPAELPVYKIFPFNNVKVGEDRKYCNKSICEIELTGFQKLSTYKIACEVIEDAPTFQTVLKEANVAVAYLPQKDPVIEGVKKIYKLDSLVNVTCTSDFSSLPTTLSWYINGTKITEQHAMVEEKVAYGSNITCQNSRLEFVIDQSIVEQTAETLELKCVAEIRNFPELRRETTLNFNILRE